ncbi:MAG: hypothetical protein ACRC41_17925 [Sarcina sp.]
MRKDSYYKGFEAGSIGIKEALSYEEKIINIIAEPYKSKDLIESIIESNRDSEILYLSSKKNDVMKKYNIERLVFDEFRNEESYYDIIIVDDLSFFSKNTKAEITEYVALLYKFSKKILIFSIEIIINNTLNIYVSTQDKETHFKEPRSIVTRFDLRKKIPDIFYRYLEWFYSKGENTVIYVSKEQVLGIYHKFKEFETILNHVEISIYDGKSEEFYKRLNNNKSSIIIHNNIQEIIDTFENANLIIYSDQKKFFNYKEIVFLCGRYSVLKEKKELILLSRKESDNIDKAKKIARIYNMIPWRY